MEVKPGYKLTEVGVIPEEWDCASIATVARLESGHTPSKRKANYWGGSVQWVSLHDTAALERREIAATAKTITQDGLNHSSARLLPAGTVVFSRTATVGKSTVMATPMATSQDFANYICGPDLHNHFLVYLFRSMGRKWQRLMAGSIHNTIYMPVFKALRIALPTMLEQRAIAAALSDMDALLDGLNRLIAKKRDLKQAAVQQLLTGQTRLPGFRGEWEMKRLGDHVRFLRNGVHSRADLTGDGSLKYLHYGDIHTCKKVILNPHVTAMPSLPKAHGQMLDRLQDGDLVFVDASEDLGGVGKAVELAGISRVEVVSGLHTIALRFDKAVLKDGFKAYLQFLPDLRTHLMRLAAGTKVYATSRAHIASAEIRLPSIVEQTAIAAVLSDMDAELSALEARRDKTRALKQAMMQELLTGKTRLVGASTSVASDDFATKSKPAPLPRSTTKPHNWQINEAVVVAMLVKQFGSASYPLGRKRCTKLAYLLHRHVEHVAEGYLKKAAGPYNPAVKYRGPEGIAQKNGYIRAHKSGNYSGFVAADKISQAEDYFDKWYGREVLDWLEQFRKKTNDELELLATVDMAVEDVKRVNAKVGVAAVKSVIRDHPEWEAKLERDVFSDANIARAIRRVIELFPTE